MLELRRLTVSFPQKGGVQPLVVVNGIDLQVSAGTCLGLVGESGSGKTVTALSILRLLGSTAQVSGEILWRGRDLLVLNDSELRAVRGRQIAFVFQNAAASLNPLLRVKTLLTSVLLVNQNLTGGRAELEAKRLLDLVQIVDPPRVLRCYPFELSGGMAQRVALAMALACQPDLLIADELTSALDPSVSMAISGMLQSIQQERNLSMLLISHDMNFVSRLCDQIAVMYRGKIVEKGLNQTVLSSPQHPYSKMLFDASRMSTKQPFSGVSEHPSSQSLSQRQ